MGLIQRNLRVLLRPRRYRAELAAAYFRDNAADWHRIACPEADWQMAVRGLQAHARSRGEPIVLDFGAMPFPVLEVHMSNLATREPWRHHSIISPAARMGRFIPA